MLTYVIRRVLYSIPVLVATSFLIFTFISLTAELADTLRDMLEQRES
jgi:ABC-type dipeptide/oligopeptide/nickel transport system permease component